MKLAIDEARFNPEDFASARKVIKALLDAGRSEVNEPSLAMLGRLIEETYFAQIAGTAYHEGWPAPGLVNNAGPLLRNHPYRHYIGVFATNTERDMQVVDLMSRVELGDVVHPMINLIV